MKQVTYEMRGLILDTMVPAITASCESLDGVNNAHVIIDGPEQAVLVLSLEDGANPAALEDELGRIATAKGLTLLNPPTVVDSPAAESCDPFKPIENVREERLLLQKPERKVGLAAAVSAVIVAVVLSVLLTTALTTLFSDGGGVLPTGKDDVTFDQLDVIDRLFSTVSVLEAPDREELLTAVLKAYVAATGDKYAEYFTEDEYADQNAANNGEMCGIGINVINGHATVNGVEYQVITVSNVYPDSPAKDADIRIGDHIMYVGGGEDKILIHDIGYTNALNLMRGEEGTDLTVTVLRANEDGKFEEIEITATRRKLTALSVTYSVYTEDPTVGILKITGFDNTTRDQFVAGIEALKKEGCTHFVFDLRNNPGGLLTAVEDVLILFLQEGDTVISIKDVSGKEKVTRIGVSASGKLTCGSGELTREDIGKYRDLHFSVLVNEYSASAAELFTANMRDHKLCSVVGVKTYGKGSMQTTFPLSKYGYSGALKLTSAFYYPPSGEEGGYDGVGITPHVVVELSEEAKTYNINLLPHDKDNQLGAAVAEAKK